MSAAKKDISGVFDAELKSKHGKQAAVLDKRFHVNHNGMTFVTDTYLPEWTEVGVEMRLPQAGAKKEQTINCRAVVVQCTRREQGKGFEAVLLFLDLPKRNQAQLDIVQPGIHPSCISISR